MTTQELLIPRIIVQKDWPGRKDFEVGQIVLLDKTFCDGSPMYEIEDCQGARMYTMAFFEMFPQEFRPLQWWEHRKPEDMPEYLRDVEDGEDGEIVKAFWYAGEETENGKQPMRFDIKKPGIRHYAVTQNIMRFYEPATAEQYNSYLKTTK